MSFVCVFVGRIRFISFSLIRPYLKSVVPSAKEVMFSHTPVGLCLSAGLRKKLQSWLLTKQTTAFLKNLPCWRFVFSECFSISKRICARSRCFRTASRFIIRDSEVPLLGTQATHGHCRQHIWTVRPAVLSPVEGLSHSMPHLPLMDSRCPTVFWKVPA